MSRKLAGLTPPCFSPGVRDHVEGRHDQAGAVADDADLAVELDVVEVLGLGGLLQRVDRGLVDQRLVVGVPEAGVLVQGDLRVQQEHPAVADLGQRVDLDQRRVLGHEGLPELHRDVDDLLGHLGRELGGGDDLARLGLVHALVGVDGDLGDPLRVLLGDRLDLHAAGHAGDAEEGAVGPVQQVGEVVLLLDVRGLGQHHLVHGVALDVHAEDVGRAGLGLVGVRGQLDAAGLAPPAHLDLGLDDDPAAEALGDGAGLLRGLGDAAAQHGQAVPFEQIAPLILEQVHVSPFARDARTSRVPTRFRGASTGAGVRGMVRSLRSQDLHSQTSHLAGQRAGAGARCARPHTPPSAETSPSPA